MTHENLELVRRSAMKSPKHGGENMIRRAQWVILALLFLALAFGTGCTSNTASVPPAQVTTVAASGAYQQDAVVGTQYTSPFTVLVTTNGTPVGGVVVTFTAPTSGAGGTFNGNPFYSTTTNASGVATSGLFTANGTIGTYNVIAASPSTESTATFNCGNTELASTISTAGGTPQSTTQGTQFNTQLSVTVKDASGASVGAQLPVTFTAPDGFFDDTGLDTTTALTNASGVATAAPYFASSAVSGTTPYTVTASVTVITGTPPLPVTYTADFTLSNTIKPAVITPVTLSTPQTTTSGTPFANLLAVTVVDATTPVPLPVVGAYVTFTAPSFTLNSSNVPSTSSGLFWDSATMLYDLPSVSVWTDASGTASPPVAPAGTNFEANALPGTYNVTASVVVSSGTTLSTDNETPKNDFFLTNQ
jgi:hypothetical protein